MDNDLTQNCGLHNKAMKIKRDTALLLLLPRLSRNAICSVQLRIYGNCWQLRKHKGNNNQFTRGKTHTGKMLASELQNTGFKLCILYKQKLINLLLIYWGITVLGSELFQIWWSSAMKMITGCLEGSKWFTEWRYHDKLFLKIKASCKMNNIK
jgi:hypothetical protein